MDILHAIGSIAVALAITACSAGIRSTQHPTASSLRSPPSKTATSPATPPHLDASASPSMPLSTLASPICQFPPSYEDLGPLPLPSPEELHWEQIQTSPGTVNSLLGLNTPILELDLAPTGGWVLTSMLWQQDGGGSDYRADYILDLIDDAHWVANHQAEGGYTQYQWLPDGRLLWIDNGQLYVAQPDGLDRQGIDSPSPIREVWVGANDTVLAGAEDGLWRLFLEQGIWESVPNAKGVSHPSSNLRLSPDGSFAAAINAGEIRYIPLERGAPARLLITIQYPGRGGRITPPSPLPDSPYWFLPEVEAPGHRISSMLLDSRDGTLHPIDEPGLPIYQPTTIQSSSPDSSGRLQFVLKEGEVPLGDNLVPGYRLLAVGPHGETIATLDLPPATAIPVRMLQVGPSTVILSSIGFDLGQNASCHYYQFIWLWEVAL